MADHLECNPGHVSKDKTIEMFLILKVPYPSNQLIDFAAVRETTIDSEGSCLSLNFLPGTLGQL